MQSKLFSKLSLKFETARFDIDSIPPGVDIANVLTLSRVCQLS